MDCGLSHFREHALSDTSTPASLFLSASHRLALQVLQVGITTQRGFVVLLGAEGLGKTTVLQAALSRLNPQQYRPFPLRSTALSLQSILVSLGQVYGYSSDAENLRVMADRLRQVLLQEEQHGRHIVLVIDDAHTLEVQTLWNLRMLSDLMQTPTGHLLQIVLVGQLTLNETLHRPELQPLRQRLTMRALLTPLTPQESLGYIHYRLAQVVTHAPVDLAPKILTRLVKDGHGNPRRLNQLCSTALTTGTVKQPRRIAANTVQEALTRRVSSPTARLHIRRGMLYAAGCLLSLGLLWLGPWQLRERLQHLFLPGPPLSHKTLASTARQTSSGSGQPLAPRTTTTGLGGAGESFAAVPSHHLDPLLPTSVDFRALVSASPALPPAEPPVLVLVTGDTYAPFTGAGLPHQGILSDIVRTVFSTLRYTVVLEFRDWQTALQATGNGQFAGMFPYTNTQEHLPHFLYSKPLYRSVMRAFVRTASPITLNTPEDLQGLSVCWAENPFPQKGGTLFAPPDASQPPQTLETCFAWLIRTQVDVVVANELHAAVALHHMGVTDTIRALPQALGHQTLHLLLPKYAPQSHTLLYEFDQALTLLEKTAALHAITARHMQRYPAFLAAPGAFHP